MEKKKEKQVIIMLIITAILITAVCIGIYLNFVIPRGVDVASYLDGEGIVKSKIEYAGYLNQKTTLTALESSDKVTRLDMITGNGDTTDIVELSGYAYMEKEKAVLFQTSVVLQDESGKYRRLRTAMASQSTFTDEKGEGYPYAYFRSIIPTKGLKAGEKYKIYVVLTHKSIQYLADTKTSVLLNDDKQLEVYNEEL